MKHTEHFKMVRELVKPANNIIEEPFRSDLNHMALGIAGEAGEIVDCIKKHTIYDQNLNVEHLIEEMGDIEFYLAHLRDILHITRDQVLEANINKLRKRYPNGYTNDAAKARADKEEDINLQNSADYAKKQRLESGFDDEATQY